MQRPPRPIVYIGLFWFVLVLCVGCGGKSAEKLPATFPVSGTVMYKGKPVKGADVVFHPQGPGNPATGTTGEDGRFVLTTYKSQDGAVVGIHVVTVQVIQVGGEPGREVKSTGGTDVPAKYRDEQKSPLTVEVKSSPNNLELKLED